jgi:hypothetical protein
VSQAIQWGYKSVTCGVSQAIQWCYKNVTSDVEQAAPIACMYRACFRVSPVASTKAHVCLNYNLDLDVIVLIDWSVHGTVSVYKYSNPSVSKRDDTTLMRRTDRSQLGHSSHEMDLKCVCMLTFGLRARRR